MGAAQAFTLLWNINEGGQYTLRWVVHDVTARRLYFRSAKQPAVKYVELKGLEFASTVPVKMLDIDTAGAGDMTGRLVRYDPAANARVVAQFFSLVVDPSAAARPILAAELERAGVKENEFIERIAQYPSSTTSARPAIARSGANR
jgi:hypothetical protein